MKLEWFRTHKNFVYWILVPMVFISFVLFGTFSGKGRSGTSFLKGEIGPAVNFTVGSKTFDMSPANVLQKRLDAWHYNNSETSTDYVAYQAASLETARQQSFDVGIEEERERLKQAVENKIRQYDRDQSGAAKANAENYQKLLTTMEMSSNQFETLVREEAVIQKFAGNLASNMIASDPQLFPDYCSDKETVRLRYKLFKSEDYLKDTKAPEEAAIKKFHDDNTKDKDGKAKEIADVGFHSILVSPMTMSIEALGYKSAKDFEVAAPKPEELKAYYDQWKNSYWKEAATPPKPGEKPADDKFKPMESVKDEVEKKWREDQRTAKKNAFMTKMSQLKTDFEADEKKFKDDPANKDKKFDVEGWAKKHDLTLWVTPEQTRDAYDIGKNEMNSPTIKAATQLWFYTNATDSRTGKRKAQAELDAFRANLDRFTFFQYFDAEKPEEGGVFVRKKVFNDERIKTLDEAKADIVAYLRAQESMELAKKAADKAHDDWLKGQDLPKIEEMEEVSSDQEKKKDHPMVMGFKRAPKVIGDVLDVQSGLPEDVEPGKNLKDFRRWYYCGCAVERKLPDWDKFAKATDTEYSRETNLREQRGLDFFSARGALDQRIKDGVHKTEGQDPPLGDVLRNARQNQN